MKRLLMLLVALCVLLTAGFGAAEDAGLRVTATIYPLYWAAQNIARDVPGVTVTCLTPPSAELHDYQMTTDDRRLLEETDLLILNGAGLEIFLDKVLPSLAAQQVDASEGYDFQVRQGHQNPHIWLTPDGMIHETERIEAALIAADPGHAAQYEVNAEAYLGELAALSADLEEGLAPYRGTPIITFHEAFDYLAAAYELQIVATVMGGHDTAPSARQLAELADLAREAEVRALFAEPGNEDNSIEILSRETGVPMYALDPMEMIDPAMDTPGAYLRIMEENLQVLLEAFGDAA